MPWLSACLKMARDSRSDVSLACSDSGMFSFGRSVKNGGPSPYLVAQHRRSKCERTTSWVNRRDAVISARPFVDDANWYVCTYVRMPPHRCFVSQALGLRRDQGSTEWCCEVGESDGVEESEIQSTILQKPDRSVSSWGLIRVLRAILLYLRAAALHNPRGRQI